MSSVFLPYITRKQMGVIFSNWKRGNLDLPERAISYFYADCVEAKGYAQNYPQFYEILDRLKHGLDHIFEGNMEEAQISIRNAYINAEDYHYVDAALNRKKH